MALSILLNRGGQSGRIPFGRASIGKGSNGRKTNKIMRLSRPEREIGKRGNFIAANKPSRYGERTMKGRK
jgi:hypothetical protein